MASCLTWSRSRPMWSYMNHSTDNPNVRPVIPARKRQTCTSRFVASRRILEGEEIVYNYGGYTVDLW